MRFYSSVMNYKILTDLKEDIIALLSSTTVSGELSLMVLQLFRVQFREEE